jgi:DNA polymerase III delta prime subunit
MPIEIVGRDEEVASVRAFVEGAAGRTAALVLEGDPGVGKSTLWLAGVEHAHAEGLQVLASRPAEAERDLAHVALGDLLEGVTDDVLPALPAPRRRALELALVHRDLGEETVDARALAVATRTALELLADEQRVLVAIDDVQWLDASSARVLAFALRRLQGVSLLLLLTRRLGEGSFAAAVEEGLGPSRVDHLRVRPLSMGAIQLLLHTRLGATFPRPLLGRLYETSGGNPFYALELARAVEAEPPADPTEPLPVPESLEGVARERLAGLRDATRAALAVVAAGGRASPELLHAAGVADEALEPAFDRGAARCRHVHAPTARLGALRRPGAAGARARSRGARRARRRPARPSATPRSRHERAGRGGRCGCRGRGGGRRRPGRERRRCGARRPRRPAHAAR